MRSFCHAGSVYGQRLSGVGDDLDLFTKDGDPRFDAFVSVVKRIIAAPVVLLSVIDDARDRAFFKAQSGLPEPWSSRGGLPLSYAFCRHVRDSDAVLNVSDARLHPALCSNPSIADLGAVAYLGVPVHGANGEPVGAFCVIDSQPRQWTDEEEASLLFLARMIDERVKLHGALQAERALRSAMQKEIHRRKQAEVALKRMAFTDPLTQIDNRLALIAGFRRMRRRKGVARPVGLFALIDIDYFKRINDRYGHAVGDVALIELGKRLRAATAGAKAQVARFGGEEFAVLIESASAEQALEVCQRIKDTISASAVTVADGEPVHLSVSMGCAFFSPAEASFDCVYKTADQELYFAKRTGRNRISVRPAPALPWPDGSEAEGVPKVMAPSIEHLHACEPAFNPV